MKLIVKIMNKIFVLVFFVMHIHLIHAQNPNFEWSKRIGGIGSDNSKATALDSRGNIYITGSFHGTVDFDPGASTYYLVAAKFGISAFITKLDSSGNFLWAKKFGSNGISNSSGLSITLDRNGNVYTTGFFTDTVDFDPGIDSFKLIAGSGFFKDIFVSKLDSSGNFVWAKRFGGFFDDIGYAIGLDSSANIYLTGYFQNTVDFNPNSGTYNLTSKGVWDIFVCKLDLSGSFIWAKQIGGTGYDVGYALDLDKQGNVYLTGSFQDTCDFDPGNGIYKFGSFGKEDIFILKLNSMGDLNWVKQIGGNEIDVGKSIKLDNFGNVIVAGGFSSIAYLYPGPAGNLITSAGKMDVFVSKFDTSGIFNKFLQIGGDSDDIVNSITIDDFGSIYCTGSFQDTVDFNPGSGINKFKSLGLNDIFILKIDSFGNYNWLKQIGGLMDDEGTSIIINAVGDLITGGDFSGVVDFDPGVGIFNQTASGTDIFIQKMKQCSNSFSTLASIGCDSVIVNNQTYKASGTYTQTRPNFTGCDSIITLNVTIKKSTSNLIFNSACDSLIINSIKYTLTGVYTQKATNSLGCDSIITLNLVINKSSSKDLNIISCKSYKLNSQLYSMSGTYYQNFKTIAGCDSTIRLILEILNADTSVTRNGSYLSSNAIGSTYQWVDCNNNKNPIQGETNKDFYPPGKGSYAVIVTKYSCTDTSLCYNVSGVGMNMPKKLNSIQVFPNPVNDKINIEIKDELSDLCIKLLSISGQVLLEQSNISSNKFSLDVSKLNEGVYILEVKSQDSFSRFKIVKYNWK